MVFRQLLVQQQVLKKGEETVGNVFIHEHPSLQRPFAQDAGAQHNLVNTIGNKVTHAVDKFWGVLIVGVEHYRNVRAEFKSFIIAAFLIATIALVLFMGNYMSNA